jgi:hypothetical protein
MSTVNGTLLRIRIGDVAIGYATSCGLDLSRETSQTVSKDSVSSWQESEPRAKSGSLTFEGFYTESETINSETRKSFGDIFALFDAGTSVAWSFSTDETGADTYTGNGFISALSAAAAVEETSTYSGTITVTGAVTKGTVS